MILNAKEEISPQELNKCIQKFYFSARKRDGRSVIAPPNCPWLVMDIYLHFGE